MMRSWVASIAWFDYGNDSAETELTKLIKPLPKDYVGDDAQLELALARVGFPSPQDRVKGTPVAKNAINRALRLLGQTRVNVTL